MLFGKWQLATLAVAAALGSSFAPVTQAAGALKEIRIDWATYNPVSMVLKEKGLLEKEFSKDEISVVWVQTLGSNKALEFLNAGSIDLGSTAGSAALLARINGNPIKSITSIHARMDGARDGQDSQIAKISDLKGKRVAVTRGTDPHIFLVRALQTVGMSEKDIARFCCSILMARRRSSRRRRRVGRSRPMMAQAEVQDGQAVLPMRRPTRGVSKRARSLLSRPRMWCAASRGLRRARSSPPATTTQARFHSRNQVARERRRQAAERAHRAHPQPHRCATRVDPGSRSGPAAAGVVSANVDVKAAVDNHRRSLSCA
jgi:hypothetical protein